MHEHLGLGAALAPAAAPSPCATLAEQVRAALSTHSGRVIDLFRRWDEDGSGTITKRELRKVLPLLGLNSVRDEATDALFDSWDDDGSGFIDYRELHATLKRGARPRGGARPATALVRSVVASPSRSLWTSPGGYVDAPRREKALLGLIRPCTARATLCNGACQAPGSRAAAAGPPAARPRVVHAGLPAGRPSTARTCGGGGGGGTSTPRVAACTGQAEYPAVPASYAVLVGGGADRGRAVALEAESAISAMGAMVQATTEARDRLRASVAGPAGAKTARIRAAQVRAQVDEARSHFNQMKGEVKGALNDLWAQLESDAGEAVRLGLTGTAEPRA